MKHSKEYTDLTYLQFYTEMTTYLDKAAGSASAVLAGAVHLSIIDDTCNLLCEICS